MLASYRFRFSCNSLSSTQRYTSFSCGLMVLLWRDAQARQKDQTPQVPALPLVPSGVVPALSQTADFHLQGTTCRVSV